MRQSLTLQQQRFADEYISNGGGAKAAAIAAGYSERSASQIATKLLGTASICAYIGERRRALEERTGITQERVLQELWDIAIADPNELIEHRVVCCRYCWGEGHLYQMTPSEMARRVEDHKRDVAKAHKDGIPAPVFDPLGGEGYNGNRQAHPECPECFGDGVGREVVKDTRLLNPATKPLYAGIKRTKEGLEVKMHPKVQALELIGRHLGMWNDKVKLQGDAENPIAMFYQVVTGSRHSIVPPERAPSSLPVHQEDPGK